MQAKDEGKPSRSSTVKVTVTVEDVNDNVPQFEGQPYHTELPENGPAGQEVTFMALLTYMRCRIVMCLHAVRQNNGHILKWHLF